MTLNILSTYVILTIIKNYCQIKYIKIMKTKKILIHFGFALTLGLFLSCLFAWCFRPFDPINLGLTTALIASAFVFAYLAFVKNWGEIGSQWGKWWKQNQDTFLFLIFLIIVLAVFIGIAYLIGWGTVYLFELDRDNFNDRMFIGTMEIAGIALIYLVIAKTIKMPKKDRKKLLQRIFLGLMYLVISVLICWLLRTFIL